MSINHNYVLHMMKHIRNEDYNIRVYCRNQTFYSIARNDIFLPKGIRSNFIHFPGFLFDIFIYRDEVTVNLTRLNAGKLILDGRNNYALIKKYQDVVFDVRIEAFSIYGLVEDTF